MTYDMTYIKTRISDAGVLYPHMISFEWRVEATKHFAKMPVRLSNGNLVWLKPYYRLWNRFTITGDGERCPEGVIDENEFLVKLLRDEIYIETKNG